MGEYNIRFYRQEDRDQYLDLHSKIFGNSNCSYGWFEWKYTKNPYFSHTPIIIAENNGEIVGARSFFGLKMYVNDESYYALQPCDTMVDPEHRRKGLFTSMTNKAIKYYSDTKVKFFFNFPNSKSLPGNIKLGWRRIDNFPTAYRIGSLKNMVEQKSDSRNLTVVANITSHLLKLIYGVLDRFQDISSEAITTSSTTPVSLLSDMYEENKPYGIHAIRDETFYGWRFENPSWDYTTYSFESDGEQYAMIVGTGERSNTKITKIIDFLPHDWNNNGNILETILCKIISDHPDTDLFSSPVKTLPVSSFYRSGFLRDDILPLSVVSNVRTPVVRSFNSYSINGIELTKLDNWSMTFAEHDIN
ncbi:GNAT family N-acetyltransferase [Natrialbaceae archaeon A-gly3]